MRFSFVKAALALPALALGASTVSLAAEGQSRRPDVMSTLASIRQTADSIAAGKYSGADALAGPARDIALDWGKVAPILAADGYVLVETKMTNAKVTALESGWKSKDVRGEAKDVSASIADLVDAEKPSR
jgi:hypothetical protein